MAVKKFPTDFSQKTTPVSADLVMIANSAAGNAAEYAQLGNLPVSTATQTALNAKQNTLTLTTTGTSGSATLVGSTLNIPNYATSGGSGTVTNVSVVSANGLGGSVANPTTTPAITLTTSVNGITKGNGTGLSAAVDGTDYLSPSTVQAEINKNTNLKRMMSTALLGDAVMTINANPAKFDIPSFSAQFVDSYTNPASPTITTYTYPGSTANTITNLATWDTTYISIDKNGVIYQSQTNDYNGNSRDRVAIGSLVHTSRTQIDYVNTFVNTVQSDLANSIGDLSEKIGIITTGNVISANGANLKINKSSGESTQIGLNWKNSKKSPNITVDTSLTAPSFFYTWRNGTGGWTTVTTSDLVPGKYDDGTGGVTQPNGSVATNKWKLDKVYYSPELGVIAIEYGQAIYNSEAEAETARSSGTVQNPATVGLVFRGWIIVRGGATTLNTSSNAVFIDAGKFGSTSGGIGSGSSTTNLQQAYENSVTPQITTDSTRGPVDTKNGSGSDTNKTSRWLNNAGTEVASIDGQGLVKGLNHVGGLTTTATSAGTTTLTVASNYNQQFTGSTTQTVVLPVASTLSVGHSFLIMNRSTDVITVNSSGGNLVQTMAPSSQTIVTCVLASGTTAASWDSSYSVTNAGTGGGTVTSVSVSSANGFSANVLNPTTTPVIIMQMAVNGMVKSNGTTASAATAGTDYVAPGAVTSSGLTMSTAKLLGRNTAGTGAVEEITLGTNLSLSGTTLNAASGSGLTWGSSISSGTGTGLTSTISNSSSSGTIGYNGVIGNTQSNAMTLINLDTGTSTVGNAGILIDAPIGTGGNQYSILARSYVSATQAVARTIGFGYNSNISFNTNSIQNAIGAYFQNGNNAGTGINTGIFIVNASTKFTTSSDNLNSGSGVHIYHYGVGGTAYSLYAGNNVNSSTNGLVNYALSNTQSGASVIQKVSLGTSAQGHTAHQIQMFGASTAQRGITLDTSTTGTGIPIEFITGGTGRTAMKFGTGFTTSTAPTGASTYIIIDIGGTSYKILAQAT